MTVATPVARVNDSGADTQTAARLPVAEVARRRFSSRAYLPDPITPEERSQLDSLLASVRTGPLGAAVRFRLVAATERDPEALRGLGTYGFIKDAPAFVVGAVGAGAKRLEDFGYLLERVVLGATASGWAPAGWGGTFSRSRFARAVGATPLETVPAVVAVGHSAPGSEDGRVLGAR